MDLYNENNERDDDIIDLLEVINFLLTKLHWIVLVTLLAGAISMAYTKQFVTPMYQASIRMVVNAKRDAYTTHTADLSGESVIPTYATVIKSNRVMEKVISTLKLDVKDWTQLDSIVSVNSVNSTPVMEIIVTHPDPSMAKKIVTTISEVAPDMIVDAVEAGSCKVISDAYCSGYPVSPNVKKMTMVGMAAGFAVSTARFAFYFFINDSIVSEERVRQVTSVPILSTIPLTDLGGSSKTARGKKKK